jgi:hypothetical protein
MNIYIVWKTREWSGFSMGQSLSSILLWQTLDNNYSVPERELKLVVTQVIWVIVLYSQAWVRISWLWEGVFQLYVIRHMSRFSSVPTGVVRHLMSVFVKDIIWRHGSVLSGTLSGKWERAVYCTWLPFLSCTLPLQKMAGKALHLHWNWMTSSQQKEVETKLKAKRRQVETGQKQVKTVQNTVILHLRNHFWPLLKNADLIWYFF